MMIVDIYEPPQGCGVGSCGPDAEDALAAFDSAIDRLRERGVTVSRYGLGLEPEAFSRNATVKAALQQSGMACLPLVIGDGQVVSQGRYPSPAELAALFGESLELR